MERRDFLIQSTAAMAGSLLASTLVGCQKKPGAVQPEKILPISRQEKPMAIAMWDFSWILRHHRYGTFENWDQVLEGLAERGYNAIRMDAMPQLVAADPEGKVTEAWRCVKDGWTPSLWGNDYTCTIHPREALLEFLPKCEKYGIRVGLATWFMGHGSGRKDIFVEEGGLLRAWRETLKFLKAHDLLDNILYVDLLNEYPFWHGYDWLKQALDKRSDIKRFRLNNPDANLPDFDNEATGGFNPLQKMFYNDFVNALIREVKQDFPDLDCYVSLDSGMDLQDIDLSEFAALDYHIWFAHRGTIPGLSEISSRDQTQDLVGIYRNLRSYWKDHRDELVQWMDGRLEVIAENAATHGIPCGNTEGWGPIFWYDHPELDWAWVKEAAEICIDLALKHENCKFLCTSNCTHPQFRGMWEDVDWHKNITGKIKA
jgi:hypothetical protein